MSETNKSLMLSEAEIIEAINSDSLISVSLGAGQPQKNVKMSTLATVAAGLFNDSICLILCQKGSTRSSLRDNVDLNNEKTPGVFFSRNGVSNSPNNNYWWYVEVIQFIRGDNRYILQRVTKDDNPAFAYQRTSNDNGWSSWVSLT